MRQLLAIQRSLEQIENALTNSIAIETLAQDANMSYWHYQRVFSAMVGEPVGRYIRRRRIAHAAKRLFDFDGTLLDLALDYQFESHEAFTRAFKSELSVTPSDWRDGRGTITFPRPKENLTHHSIQKRYQHMNLTPEILTLPAQSFIGLQATFISASSEDANNLQIIPALWTQFFPLLPQIPTDEPGAYYGLCENLESRGVARQHPDEVLYLASARVPASSTIPDGMKCWTSPGGTFAKFTHQGRIEKIGETMGYIYGKWFPTSQYKQAPGPDFERYDHRFDPSSDESQLEIYVPIEQS